jgi:hypothetical protein
VTYSDPGRDKIIENLDAAINRLRVDVARVEMWAIALVGFSRPIPDYQTDQFLLPPKPGKMADASRRRGGGRP